MTISTVSASTASTAVLAERRLTGSLLFPLAGLAALGALTTNIIPRCHLGRALDVMSAVAILLLGLVPIVGRSL